MPKPLQFFVIALVFFVHLWLVLAAISWMGAIDLHPDLMKPSPPFTYGLVMAQCGLLTLLAFLVRLPGYVRMLGFFAGWLIPCITFSVITDRQTDHKSIVLIGIILAVQSVALVLLVSTVRLAPHRFRQFLFGEQPTTPRRFGIKAIFLWTGVFAIIFGVGRFLADEFEWNIDPNFLTYLLPFYLPFAITNALILMSVVATYWPRDWRARMYLGGISAAITIAVGVFNVAFINWVNSKLAQEFAFTWTLVISRERKGITATNDNYVWSVAQRWGAVAQTL